MEDFKEKAVSLRYRLLSSALFLPILIWLIYWRWNWPFMLLITVVVLFGLKEYFNMLNLTGINTCRITAYLGAGFMPLTFMKADFVYPACLVTLVFVVMLIRRIFIKKEFLPAIQCVSAVLLGIIYVGWLPSHLLALKTFPNGNNLVFYCFTVTWIGDSVAYFVGTNFGKHKFFPNISPKKTKEGVTAGIIGSVLAGIIFIKIFRFPSSQYLFYFALSFIIGVMAVFGDLFESFLKRSLHIKDAGTIIPGHGGILDRFDSIFFTAPAMYYLVYFFA